MKKRIVSVICILAMLTSLLVGCGKQTSTENTNEGEEKKTVFNVAIDYMPDSLIPTFVNGDSYIVITRAIYDSLFYESKDDIIYRLADKLDISEDKLSYTVHLNDEAIWSDGEPITVDDILFSIKWEEHTSGGISPCSSYDGEPIELNKIDDKTIEFKLPKVNNIFIYLLSTLAILPEHPFDNDPTKIEGSDYFSTPGMATSGAYEVTEINADSLVYSARDNYYGGKPKTDTIVCKVLGVGSPRQIAFDSGELSYIRCATEEELEKYESNDEYNIYSISEGRLNYLQLNPYGTALSGLNDDARKAICLALNQEEILSVAYGSDELVSPANSFMTPDQAMYDSECPGYSYDLEEAKKLAKSSGLVGKTLTYIYNTDRVNMEGIATAIQQQLAAIDVKVDVQGLDTSTFFEEFWKGKDSTWDLGTNGWDSQYGSSIVQAAYYLNNQEDWGWSTDIVEKTNRINETANQEEYEKMVKELQTESLNEYRMYPLTYTNFVMASQKNVSGLDTISIVPEFGDYASITVK